MHPWVFRQAVQAVEGDPAGGLCAVEDPSGARVGWGFYSESSLIAVRMVSYGEAEPPGDWLSKRLQAALLLRGAMAVDSDAFRLVNAEGDALPGLVVDVFADTAVVSLHSKPLSSLLPQIAGALRELLPGRRIYVKRDEHASRAEGMSLESGYESGDGDGTCVIREGTLRFQVDYARGQKTGFYLDQRENRFLLGRLSAGRRVLNLFSYTGAFGLHAARGGAASVVSVESSDAAVRIASGNAALNPGLDAGVLDWRRGDVFEYLADEGKADLIVLDPPPFARRRSELPGALRGYESINERALALLNPGGLLFTFSCSGAVDKDSFRRVLCKASLRSGRFVRFLRELHADADHPVSSRHPEGEYLKGWVLHAQ